MISWAQLTTPPSTDALFARVISFAKALKLPTSSWGPKNFLRAALSLFAQLLGDQFGTVIAAIAKGGFRTQASGDWLTLIAEDFYSDKREPGVFAIGSTSVANGTAAPINVDTSALYLQVLGGLLFKAVDVGTVSVPAGSSIPLSWQAEHAGITYNVGGESIVGLATPIPGITVSAAAGQAWLTQLGVDDESDEDLAARLGEKWSTLGTAGAIEAYVYLAQQASNQVTRARFYEETPSPGWITGYLAGPTAPVTSATATAVRAWFETNAKRPGCVGLLIYPAASRVVTLTGTLYVKAAQLAAAQSAIAAKLVALEASTDFGGLVDLNEVIALLRSAPGVTYLSLTTPVADISLAPAEIVSFVNALTYVPQ